MEDNNSVDTFIKSLPANTQKFYEWAKLNNIYPKITQLTPELWGFVYKSNHDNYYIIINKNLSHELQQKIFIHEVKHIHYDLPKKPYIVGFNMQHSQLEQKADLIAEQSINSLKKD